MTKGLLKINVICVCLIFSLQTNLLYAASKGNPAVMQDHIEKVKLKKPAEYQEMVDKAGGTITTCLSCHVDFNKKKNASGKTNAR